MKRMTWLVMAAGLALMLAAGCGAAGDTARGNASGPDVEPSGGSEAGEDVQPGAAVADEADESGEEQGDEGAFEEQAEDEDAEDADEADEREVDELEDDDSDDGDGPRACPQGWQQRIADANPASDPLLCGLPRGICMNIARGKPVPPGIRRNAEACGLDVDAIVRQLAG